MRKGAYLELALHDPTGSSASDTQSLVHDRLAGDHQGLHIQVLQTQTDSADLTTRRAVLYVEGDQPAPDDFEQLATSTVQQLWKSRSTQVSPGAGRAAVQTTPSPDLVGIEEWEGYDTAGTLVAAPGGAPAAMLAAAQECFAPVTGGTPAASAPLPADTSRPAPLAGVFDGCPAGGDDGEPQQDTLKNRTDMGNWQLTTVGAMLDLPVPASLPTHRTEWSADDQAAIERYEGLPLQVVGFLVGARIERAESCNCHSVTDLDYHLWLVDTSGTGREASVVAEVTPRVRANHPGWSIDRICPLVTNQTQVRISGWLMMDPFHPDQVGTTRGTTWEIHPILAIDVAQDGGWVPLDNMP